MDVTIRQRRVLAGVLATVLFGACGTATRAPNSGSVRVVSVTPIEPEPGAGSGPDLLAETPSETLAEENLAPDPTKVALERAIDLATEALAHYAEDPDDGAVHQKLGDARIALLEADLPEAMQDRGLSVLNWTLPMDMKNRDLETLYWELEDDARGNLDERAYIAREARRLLDRFAAAQPTDEEMAVFVDEVEHYIAYYRGSARTFFERAYQRKHKYWPTIEAAFGARRIPIELGYMAMVESGFWPRARSRANARGLWQFIPGTGRRYGLRHTDDFYDVARSTEAAAEYLLDLIGIFGSDGFLLATAAYNAGEGRIQGCLRKLDDPFGGRSFWAIRDCLARETREYVPRILAAAIIGRDPSRFGFELPSQAEALERYDVVVIPRPTSVANLASRAGVSVAALRDANEDLGTRSSTPSRNYPMYIPKDGGTALANSLRASPAPVPQLDQVASERSDGALMHVVKRGDTLSHIGEAYGVSVAQLLAWNPSLRGAVLGIGDRVAVDPRSARTRHYRVRNGDTLGQIAERFDVRLADLASANSLRAPYRLRVGHELVIPAGGGRVRGTVRYVVKRGNSLETIARLFDVATRDLRAWNGLSSNRVRAGQRLEVRPSKPHRPERYRVRRGDTIERIARRYGVATGDVLTANGLGGRSVIHPGQELEVWVID